MTKTELFEAALRAGHDLGGKSIKDLVKEMYEGYEVPHIYIGDTQTDPISAIIYDAFTRVDKDDIERDLHYAISQLKDALESIRSNQMN